MRKANKLSVASALAILYLTTVSALASSDPLSNCTRTVEESKFEAAGGKLDEITHADLLHFPSGFLENCHGDISYDAVIVKNGAVVPIFLNHFVWCGKDNRDSEAMFRSNDWHRSVITPRLKAIQFSPPYLQGRAVCVKIHRDWLADSPNRFWSPEEWAHRK